MNFDQNAFVGKLIEKRSKLLSDFLREHGMTDPKSVEFRPLVGCVEGACFKNVETQVRCAGGKIEFGWVFWHFVDIAINTEAHAVWITPQGRRMDITPRSLRPERRVLFLPDSRVGIKRTYTCGYQTVLSADETIRKIGAYQAELNRIIDESFLGIGHKMLIPRNTCREIASRLGITPDLEEEIYEDRKMRFSF